MGYTGGRLSPLFDPSLSDMAAQEMADDGGDAMMEFAVAFTPVNERVFEDEPPKREPGTLKSMWMRRPVRREVRRGHPAHTAEFVNVDPIAPFVEWDTRPHIITPRGPGYPLRFRLWPSGTVVRTMLVRHPGTTGQHMTTRAATATEVVFRQVTRPALERWAKRVVRTARKANA